MSWSSGPLVLRFSGQPVLLLVPLPLVYFYSSHRQVSTLMIMMIYEMLMALLVYHHFFCSLHTSHQVLGSMFNDFLLLLIASSPLRISHDYVFPVPDSNMVHMYCE